MDSKIHPYSTYLRRIFRFPRLWRINLFSTKLANKLYEQNGKTTTFQVTSLPRQHEFHNISSALRKKNIQQIHFSSEFRVFLPKKHHILFLLPEAIRIAVRELASFGIPKTAKFCRTLIKDKEDKRYIRCLTTITPRTKTEESSLMENEVEINFGIY